MPSSRTFEDRGSSALHVVLGAGQVGRPLARRLAAQGHRVRVVRRGEPVELGVDVEWARGDVLDASFLDRALRGATVVYHCANPDRYDRWEELLPPLSSAILGGAARAGSRLVVLDNLYMYGMTPPGERLSEASPVAPRSRKGELRARLAQELLDAHGRGDVQVAIGRASDFFGPGCTQTAVFGDRFLTRLRSGASIQLLGNPDMPHAYSYVEDVAEGLAALGADERGLGQVWHLPVAFSGSTRELVQLFGRAMGRALKVSRVPLWALRLIGLFDGQAGAAVEMVYQWESPFLVDDRRFRERFALEPTPVDAAVAATAQAMLRELGEELSSAVVVARPTG